MSIQPKVPRSRQRGAPALPLHVRLDNSDTPICGARDLDHTVSVVCAKTVPDEWLCDDCRSRLLWEGVLKHEWWTTSVRSNEVALEKPRRMTLTRTA